MLTATPTTDQYSIVSPSEKSEAHGVIETRLWLEEHTWLYRLLRSEDNVSPTFRFPDLISACVSLVFEHHDAPARIFRFLGTELVLRSPQTPRRRESMWRQQYQLLLEVQRSPANRHPNPPCAGPRMAQEQPYCGRHAAIWPNDPIAGETRRPAESVVASTVAPNRQPYPFLTRSLTSPGQTPD